MLTIYSVHQLLIHDPSHFDQVKTMIRMPQQRSLNKDREQDLKRPSFTLRNEPWVDRFEDSLSFLSVKGAIRSYPDTGESGDAYDAESSP